MEHLIYGHFRSAVECVRGVAPRAAKIAPGETDKDAGQAGPRALALNGFENLGNDHASLSGAFRFVPAVVPHKGNTHKTCHSGPCQAEVTRLDLEMAENQPVRRSHKECRDGNNKECAVHSAILRSGKGLLRRVGRGCDVGYPNRDAGDSRARRQSCNLLRSFLVEMFCQVFCRGIDARESRQVVEKLMVEPLDDAADNLLEMEEITKQTDGIELCPFNRNLHLVIVPVQVLALSAIAPQGMSG